MNGTIKKKHNYYYLPQWFSAVRNDFGSNSMVLPFSSNNDENNGDKRLILSPLSIDVSKPLFSHASLCSVTCVEVCGLLVVLMWCSFTQE